MKDIDVKEIVDSIEDFDIQDKPARYEVWLLGYTEDNSATDFEQCLDAGYTELTEAQKCFEYFQIPSNLKEFLEIKKVSIPDEVKHLNLVLEQTVDTDADWSECVDLINSVEIVIE